MRQIASRSQLRMSLLRLALVFMPMILLLGFLSGYISGSGAENGWYAALEKPAANPPGWVFPLAWTIFYAMMGFALAIVVHARGAAWRGLAIAAFVLQLVLNLAWSPMFFGLHEVTAAFWLLVLILAAALLTTLLFGQVRASAAWLMVPYLAWLCFAAALNRDIDLLNPDAETLAPGTVSTQI